MPLIKKLLFLLLFIPAYAHAQRQLVDHIVINDVDSGTGYRVKRTAWLTLERGNFRKNLNTFYRISETDGQFFLDLKVSHGGDAFVVPRNAMLKLQLQAGEVVTLYSTTYKVAGKGEGARAWGGNDAKGAQLTYLMTPGDVKQLMHDYVVRIRLYTGEGYVEKTVTEHHAEIFMDQVTLLWNAH